MLLCSCWILSSSMARIRDFSLSRASRDCRFLHEEQIESMIAHISEVMKERPLRNFTKEARKNFRRKSGGRTR